MDNISHAYIFLGDEEETTQKALKLAQTANCENTNMAPCGFCSTCRKIQSQVYPDVIHVHPDGAAIKIEQVRKIILDLTEKPMEGNKKVYILHEAHTITPQAQNALLKTLEEPCSESIIILLSNNIKQLIPTVVSRCQIQDFTKAEAELLLSVESRQKIADIIFNTMQKAGHTEFAIYARELSDIEEKIEEVLEVTISLFRDMLIVKTNADAALINQDLEPMIYKYSSILATDSMLRAIDVTYRQLKAAKFRGNKNLIWYNLLVGLKEVF
ncbi:DNA polymerase III gamma/tau subunits [Tepidanaerobacter acetatoxydans Re1]|uniref:DNA polymerase III gamma/tau subunits n=1 Tax=Tepidanaerobacter acetatoxydans (strain DSM 21804 / JCM 16047 / Re1) TaxID=1209989 RepID=F4LRG5_TEPAE|nr:DNA polymerase III subunit [Tepidanaerobacter acetatoxydans]AEE90228.1 DNA polymerase III gamma/tau subunits [Tepidanaerobacter acetatoxydans Re1]CCP24690.1 DNA polymerase III gamma/tau subunits [Tepidanaerobacter acetatoxydans Re1]